jgi:hypothetical protein
MMTTSDRPSSPWPILFLVSLAGLLALLFAPVTGEALRAWMHGRSELAAALLAAQAGRVGAGLVRGGAGLGLLAAGFVLAADRLRQEKPGGGWFAVGVISLLPGLAWWGWGEAARFLNLSSPPLAALIPWGLGVAGGVFSALAWLRWGAPALDVLRHRGARRSGLERNKKTDVREIGKMLPAEIGKFDPARYFRERRFFVGLDEDRHAVYLDPQTWRLSHVLLSGRTRAGKGVVAQTLLAQACMRGEFVVVLDPKGDEWLPHVLHAACEKCDAPYLFVDLRQPEPQIGLFSQARPDEIETMLIGGFSLAEKGEAADFYRLADRAAAREAAQALAAGRTPARVLAELGKVWVDSAAGFHASFVELVNTSSCSATDFDWEGWAHGGGCLYVVGDALQPALVRAQRMVALRLMLLAKKLQEEGRPMRTITLFADEFKWHISRPFMAALGMAAGWGVHCVLAMQSLQDLSDVPADLDKDAVRGAVMENCAIQLSYAIKDPETAEWLARSTGTVQVDDEMRTVQRNVALAETVDPERRIRQAERYLIDENMFLMLPKGCAVLSVPGQLARFVFTSPLKVEKTPAAREIRPAAGQTPPPAPQQTQQAQRPAQPEAEEDFL